MTGPGSLGEVLATRLMEHTAVVGLTGDEGEIADGIEQRFRAHGDHVRRVGHSLVITPPSETSGERPLVLLVGHLDVVAPTDDDRQPRRTTLDGADVVIARGASDMKSGNVVAMQLFERDDIRQHGAFDLALVLYAGEEGPADGNELEAVLDASPELARAALAIVLEPTDGHVELGCLGGLHAHVTFKGRQAHSARPWQGDNALAAAARCVTQLTSDATHHVEVDGIGFFDVWTPTQIWTDPQAGRNVVPGACTVNLNFRFAPSRSLEDAERELRDRISAIADVPVDIEIVDRAPPAAPHRHAGLVDAFVDAVTGTHPSPEIQVRGKQAWTDVARFAQRGIPALNFGPGLTAQAHQRGEYVPIEAMVTASTALERFLTNGDAG